MEYSSRRVALQEATAKAHRALEARIGPLQTLDSYGAYVGGLYAFRAPLEAQLEPYAQGLGWRACRIAAELEQDMADLGLSPPPPLSMLGPASRDEAMGYFYVLEGSGLGARVLTKYVLDLGLSEDWGARHLFKQAEAAGQWRTFVAALEAPDLDIALMRCGAVEAFRLAREAMESMLAYA